MPRPEIPTLSMKQTSTILKFLERVPLTGRTEAEALCDAAAQLEEIIDAYSCGVMADLEN